MTFSDRIVAALQLTLKDPAAAFGALQLLRQEALASGAMATASVASRALVFAAALAGDATAELRFATEWQQETDDEQSRHVLRAISDRNRGNPQEPTEGAALFERLVLLVDKLLFGKETPELAIDELRRIRNEAIRSIDYPQLAARCLHEMILAMLDSGRHEDALEHARILVSEARSGGAFYMLGRAAVAAGESDEGRRAYEIALRLSEEEGNADGRAAAEVALAQLLVTKANM